MGCLYGKRSQVGVQSEASSEPSPSTQIPPNINRKNVQRLPDIRLTPTDTNRSSHEARSSWSEQPTQSASTSLDRKHVQESNDSANNVINILLLGESGVGKSTFINALANYLTFDTLEDAHAKKPRALIPVSFFMTEGDDFKEHTIKFGDKDPNEIHNQAGQSVTQHCQSYDFSVGTPAKIRLIDTPGMGDTRGIEQDDRNIQHILSYINELSHLNAVCILLKPNESRLNIVFRSCFTQLINFLGKDIRENIIFCFTNTRSTFYTPGDTAPLLKQMLGNLPINNIPFEKSNTFCFDSESFRYLIARENGIKFDDDQKKEYQQSWASSVTQSKRFLQYVCDTLKSYPQSNWRSIEHAQFRIHRMIRPLLETIRNIFRNLILINENRSKTRIQLRLTTVSQSSTICSGCTGVLQNYSGFWVLQDELHMYSNQCTKCRCSRQKHIDVSCRLDYELLDNANKQSANDLKQNLNQLQQASVKFGCFFLRCDQKQEPIFSFLNEIIEEEKKIINDKRSECFNPSLLRELNQFRVEYEHQQNSLMSQRDSTELSSIYQLIQNVNGMNLIRKQMNDLHENS